MRDIGSYMMIGMAGLIVASFFPETFTKIVDTMSIRASDDDLKDLHRPV